MVQQQFISPVGLIHTKDGDIHVPAGMDDMGLSLKNYMTHYSAFNTVKSKLQKVGSLKFANSFMDYVNVKVIKTHLSSDRCRFYSTRDSIKLLILMDTYSSFI